MPQYTFPLTLPPVFSEDNFHVSDCNRDAYEWVMRWPDWPAAAFLLHGPAGAGKSHLGRIWAARANASIFSARDAGGLCPDAALGHWLIEDIGHLSDERTLLHLLNYSRENGAYLLLTADRPAGRLPFALPDLVSRLRALPAVGIAPPDEEAMAAAMRKQFADRQLKVDEDVIGFLLPRMERSFASVTAMVDMLDKAALAEQRNLTIPFVKRALGC